MTKLKTIGSVGIVSMAALTLVACGKNNQSNSNDAKTASKFPSSMPKKAAEQGGTVKVALETDTPFTGIFSDQLATTSFDAQIASPGAESLFDTDDYHKINDKGPATIKINQKNKTITITLKKGVKWSDGKQVTAKDLEYPYEILGNKKTKAQRYSTKLEVLKGLKEYHEGKAKTISGIELPDGDNGLRMILHFSSLKPGMSFSGNDYYVESAAPYHYLKDVPFNKLESSDKIRKKPLYFGPYKLAKLVRGQSVTWIPNKYYWRGKPKLAKIVYQVVSPNSASQAIKSHKFDIVQVVNSQWKEVKNTEKVKFIAQIPLYYSYLGFKVGKWDAKKGKNVMNPNSKMNNRSLRQAIGYAMNIAAVNKRYTNGLSFQIPTLIPKQFGDFYNPNVKGFTYNLKKANELLDKAGYKKKGKWRVQPNGKPLKINLLAMSGAATQEPIVQNYIQQWHKIGLNVGLLNGRLTEINSFYDKVQNDDRSVDMFMAAWGLSNEPSPNGLYSEGGPANYTRFVTAENNKLIDEIDSEKAFNHKYRVQKFHEWQEYMFKDAYVIPMYNAYKIYAVNDRLTGYSLKPSESNNDHPLWYQVGYVK